MNDPNKNCSEETLRRLKAESYERLRIELLNSIEMLLNEFGMSWNDLAEKLKWKVWDGTTYAVIFGKYQTGDEVKKSIGGASFVDLLDLEKLNEIAACFSTEAYIIFRPRAPYTNS